MNRKLNERSLEKLWELLIQKPERNLPSAILWRTEVCLCINFTSSTKISTAGSDTTAACLTFLLYNLLTSNRKHWDRLSKEVRSQYGSIDDIFTTSAPLPFLDAVVNEGLFHIFRIKLSYDSPPISAFSSFQPTERSSSWRNVYWRPFYPRNGSPSDFIAKAHYTRPLSAHQSGQFITMLDISPIQISSYLNVGCQKMILPKAKPRLEIKQRGSLSQLVQEHVLENRMFSFFVLKLKMKKTRVDGNQEMHFCFYLVLGCRTCGTGSERAWV